MNLNDAIFNDYNPSPTNSDISRVIIDDRKSRKRTDQSPYASRSISDIIIRDESINSVSGRFKERILEFEELVRGRGDISVSKEELQSKYPEEINQLAKDLGTIFSSEIIKAEDKKDEVVQLVASVFNEYNRLKDESEKRENREERIVSVQKLDIVEEEKGKEEELVEDLKDSTNEFVERVEESYSKDRLKDSSEELVEKVFDDIKNLYDYAINDSYIGSMVSDLPSFVGTFIDNAVLSPVSELIGTSTDAASVIVDIPGNIVSQFKDYAENWISNRITNISSQISNITSGIVDAANDWLSGIFRNNYSTFNTSEPDVPFSIRGERGVSDVLYSYEKYRDYNSINDREVPETTDTESYYKWNERNQWSFGVRDQLELSNEMYWSVQVTPHTFNGYTPPSLHELFGMSESSRLPIISYDLNANSISSQEYELFPGSTLSFPSQHNKPSKITLTFPEYINRDRGLVVQRFKQEYINYVFRDLGEVEGSNAVRDFRECSYEIEISRYSMNWHQVAIFRYLAYPEFAINIRGSSQSSAEMVDLSFNIVGEYYE